MPSARFYHPRRHGSGVLRDEQTLARHDRRPAQAVRVLELPHARSWIPAVACRGDRPQRLPRLDAMDARSRARAGVAGQDGPDEDGDQEHDDDTPNTCSHYGTNTCSCQGNVSGRAPPDDERPARAVRLCCELHGDLDPARRAPAGAQRHVERAQAPTDTDRQRRPVFSGPAERTHTLARASSPAATRVVIPVGCPPTSTFVPSTSEPGAHSAAPRRTGRRRSPPRRPPPRAAPIRRPARARPGSRSAGRRRGSRRSSARRRRGHTPPRGSAGRRSLPA